MLTDIAFTDPQGNVYTDAVVCAYELNHNNSIGRTINMDDDERDFLIENSNQSISVKYAYWISQSAFDNRSGCYWLGNFREANEYWNIDNKEIQKTKYSGLTSESIAELYFVDEILPQLT